MRSLGVFLIALSVTVGSLSAQTADQAILALSAGQPQKTLGMARAAWEEAGEAQVVMYVLSFANYGEASIELERDSTVLRCVKIARGYYEKAFAPGASLNGMQIRAVLHLASYEARFGSRAKARPIFRAGAQQAAKAHDQYLDRAVMAANVALAATEGTVKQSDLDSLEARYQQMQAPANAALVGLILSNGYRKHGDYDKAIVAALGVKSDHFMPSRLLVAARAARAKGDKAAAAKYYAQILEKWKNAEPGMKPSIDRIKAEAARTKSGA